MTIQQLVDLDRELTRLYERHSVVRRAIADTPAQDAWQATYSRPRKAAFDMQPWIAVTDELESRGVTLGPGKV